MSGPLLRSSGLFAPCDLFLVSPFFDKYFLFVTATVRTVGACWVVLGVSGPVQKPFLGTSLSSNTVPLCEI